MHKFHCFNCGRSELSYEKWVKSVEKVVILPDDRIKHHQQKIDKTDVLGAAYHYICTCCDRPPMFRGDYITTEDELKIYLSMTADERVKMQADYNAMVEEENALLESEGRDGEVQRDEFDETEPK
jgi:hypothetical protein